MQGLVRPLDTRAAADLASAGHRESGYQGCRHPTYAVDRRLPGVSTQMKT